MLLASLSEQNSLRNSIRNVQEQNSRCNNRVEGASGSEVEQAVDQSEDESHDGRSDGELELSVNLGEVVGVRDAVLEGSVFVSPRGRERTYITSQSPSNTATGDPLRGKRN